ncbi:hypothetical protein L1987_38777 [Smallanthus sonchifolius]|uniref:Uncharacterized protein n=1 Tax=Smallanthus sonchifolius TaxID=185202 RepID=A0ACB9HLB6_9ASTR|nr:hypothetical protein L1987_38777 [Smallanthus sonchifolius]
MVVIGNCKGLSSENESIAAKFGKARRKGVETTSAGDSISYGDSSPNFLISSTTNGNKSVLCLFFNRLIWMKLKFEFEGLFLFVQTFVD